MSIKIKDAVDAAKKRLEAEAFKTKKAYLTGINSEINSVVQNAQNVKDSFGRVFMKPKIDPQLAKIQKEIQSNMNPHDVIYAGFGVTIKGKPLSSDRLDSITGIEINQEVGTSDTATLSVTDAHLKYIEDDIYVKDSEIVISITLEDDPFKVLFVGYISAIDIEFPEDGAPKLQIHCIDKGHEMTREKKKRSWSDVTSSQVVQQIAQEYGYQCYVEPDYPFPVQASIVQSDKTDLEFLEELAGDELDLFVCNLVTDTNGKTTVFYVIEGHLNKQNPVVIAYRNYDKDSGACYDIKSFSPKINIETRQEKVKSDGINSDTKGVESTSNDVPSPSSDSSSDSSSGSDAGSSDNEERDNIDIGG